MLVSPRPGVNRENLLDTLRRVHTDVFNIRGGGGTGNAYKRLLAYLDWTTNAVQMLTNQISTADINALVLTRRYELLLAGVGNMAGIEMEVQRAVNGLVSAELDARVTAFDEAIKVLDNQIRRWPRTGKFVLPDTSFYIQHPQKLEDADVAPLVEAGGHPIHIIVPIAVIDELDRLKEIKDRDVRWRAGYTLAVIDRLFAITTNRAQLHPEVAVEGHPGLTTRGAVTIDLLFDPPGHTRLPITDDEIIDRAITTEPLTGSKITLLTYDTGQSTRARAAGLSVIKLTKAIGDEPD